MMGDISEEIKSKFKNNKVKALLNILYTANWINSYQTDFFRTYELSPQQYNVLRILNGAKKPMQVQAIKDRMIERSPNATRLMDKLCAKGLIGRTNCPDDRRVVHIEITEKGLSLLNNIDIDFDKVLMKNITEKEACVLSGLLDKLR